MANRIRSCTQEAGHSLFVLVMSTTWMQYWEKIKSHHQIWVTLNGNTSSFRATPHKESFFRVLSSCTVSIKHINSYFIASSFCLQILTLKTSCITVDVLCIDYILWCLLKWKHTGLLLSQTTCQVVVQLSGQIPTECKRKRVARCISTNTVE